MTAQTPGYIETIAGTGTLGNSGDGGLALNAQVDPSWNVADASGNVYFVEGNYIEKITRSTGIISPVAGIAGSSGYNGDNQPATSAWLNSAGQIAIDASGNLYIADTGNQRIREVSASTGLITTVAGAGSSGSACPGSSVPQNGILALNVYLCTPAGVAVDAAGNIFISDTHEIYRVDASTGILDTIAGNGTGGTNGDGGLAVNASLDFPFQIGVDGEENVYIQIGSYYPCQYNYPGQSYIRKIQASTGIIDSFETDLLGPNPQLMTVDLNGDVYVYNYNELRKFNASSGLTFVAGNGTAGYNGDNQFATSATLSCDVTGASVDSSGNIYISDGTNYRIREVYALPSGPKYFPSSYLDIGGDPTSNPSGPLQGGNADVVGFTTYNWSPGPTFIADTQGGNCIWSAFPSHVDTNNLTLYIPYRIASSNGNPSQSPPFYTVTVTIGGTPTTLRSGPAVAESGILTATVPAGTDLSMIQIEVVADTAGDDGNANPNDASYADITISMYVQ